VSSASAYELLEVEHCENTHVTTVRLNRPSKYNAMNPTLWTEIGAAFRSIGDPTSDSGISLSRVVLLEGAGKHFTSGLDLNEAAPVFGAIWYDEQLDTARKALRMQALVRQFQECFTAVEQCPVPVIAAIHGLCLGAGVDLIAACDVRYASEEAAFAVKEVDVGLAADVGTLQRVPKLIGNHSLFRELCYTGRQFTAEEALDLGLLSGVLDSPELLRRHTRQLAEEIGRKSPVAVMGTKRSLNYSRDHSVAAGLDHIATWNAAMLQTEDMQESLMASMEKRTPTYKHL